MKKSKFVSLSQFASKATGGVYGSSHAAAPSLPPSSNGPSLATPTGAGPHTPRGVGGGSGSGRDTTMERKRMAWADRVREKLPPLEPNEYEVLWERGVLGVIFLESEKDGIPYVSKATESCISPLVQPGDILKFVNDVRSEKHSFSDFFKILATMKKPVLLRFERPPAASANSSGGSSRAPSPEGALAAHEFPRAPPLGDHHRSVSAQDVNQNTATTTTSSSSRTAAMKDAAKALAAKVQRANSLPQNDRQQQPPTPSPALQQQKPVARGTFWRASTAANKEKEAAVAAATPKMLSANMPATPKTPRRRDMQSPVATTKPKYDGDTATDTSDSSPHDPWDDDDRAHDDDTHHYIEVYWETGSLGLFFGEERGTGYPVVTRSTPGVNPSVHRKVQVNDVLLAANGVRSIDFTFDAFFARLQQMSKPVKLVFRRKVRAPGTPPPPPPPRKTSQPTETAVPPLPPPTMPEPALAAPTTPQPTPSSTETTTAVAAGTPPLSRPTRLPPPTPTSDNAAGMDGMRHTVDAAHLHQGSGLVRQEPSPQSKTRSTSVETRSLMEDQRSPVDGSLIGGSRGKHASSRPDIIFLGSPQKKPRGPPRSPLASSLAVVDAAAPSSRDTKQRAASPQPANARAPSPRDTRPSPRPEKPRQDVLVLGDDFGVSPREKLQAVEITEEDVVNAQVAASPAQGHVLEEGIAVGVPVESVHVLADADHVESAVVADAVLAEMVGDAVSASAQNGQSTVVTDVDVPIEVGLPVPEINAELQSGAEDTDNEDSDDAGSQSSTESESDEGESLDVMVQDDPDISGELDSNELLAGGDSKGRGSIASPTKPNKAALNASLAKYKKKAKNSRPVVKLPAINEDASQTVPLTAPNAVNTNVQVRGRTKPKPSLVDTPDSSTYLVKWKEGRSVGLQLREVRMAKGTFPLVVDVCKEPCCDVLKHICIGDVIVEINGRNCSTMGVKKTVNFLRTSSKTMLLKLRRGPAFLNERVSAYA